jgi:hypothetical protein
MFFIFASKIQRYTLLFSFLIDEHISVFAILLLYPIKLALSDLSYTTVTFCLQIFQVKWTDIAIVELKPVSVLCFYETVVVTKFCTTAVSYHAHQIIFIVLIVWVLLLSDNFCFSFLNIYFRLIIHWWLNSLEAVRFDIESLRKLKFIVNLFIDRSV